MALGRKTGGRTKGTFNKATAEVRSLATEYGPDAVKELARLSTAAESEQARISACNSILERAYGRSVAGRPIVIDFPDTSTPSGVVSAVAAVVRSVSQGEITTVEASDLCSILEVQRRVIETSDLDGRLARLEAVISGKSPTSGLGGTSQEERSGKGTDGL